MTTRVMVVANLSEGHECHVHVARRDEHGKYEVEGEHDISVIKGPCNNQFFEFHLPDHAEIRVHEHVPAAENHHTSGVHSGGHADPDPAQSAR
jgi:hypothetical protein